MASILEIIQRDIIAQGGGQPGFLLQRTGEIVEQALELPTEAGLDQAATRLEVLYKRVLRYRDDLLGLEVPAQESERHRQLLEAFRVYSEVLLDLFDAICGDAHLYHPRLLHTLAAADRCLYRHCSAAVESAGLERPFLVWTSTRRQVL